MSWKRAMVVTLAVLAVAAFATTRIVEWFRPLPNVVVITIDTLRADHVGSYGAKNVETPTLDALAARGVRFSQAIAPVPLTLPSHTSILTGRTPAHHGVRNNPEFVVPESVPTLAEQFRAGGYETAAFVSGYPLSRAFGLARGFDVYDDRFRREDGEAPYTERRGDRTVAAVRAWFGRRQQDQSGRPYFLWVHFFDPHRPYDPPPPFRDRFADRPYDGEIAFVDAQVRELLALTGDPAGQRTIILVAADHGEGLGEHGEPTHGLFIYDSTIRVPLIVAGPGVPAGRVVESTVSLVDVTPTLLELARRPALANVDGRSLARLFGAAGTQAAAAYAESLFGRLCCGWAPLHGWRDANWMFIDAPAPELYDVKSDPGENMNVAASHAADVARFQAAVKAAATSAPDQDRARATQSAARLASLGYFAGAASAKPSMRDPKDMAAVAVRMENAIARERSEPATAVADLRAVIEADPMNTLARRHLAIALSSMHNYAAAIAEIDRLHELGDTTTLTAILLGECQRLDGRAADAVKTLQQAVERDERDPAVWNAYGRALTAAGERDKGLAAFRHALELQPDDGEAMSAVADMAIEAGDLVTARQTLETLAAGDPDDRAVQVKLAAVLARTGDLPSAITRLKTVLDHDPSNVDALVNLGAAYAKAGDPGDAVRYFERALSAGARSPIVLNSLAAARLETGDRPGAIAVLRRSLAAQPNQPDIRQLLQQAESGQ
jgi:arylsulfatase A-like enzyme/tetratricopeptide (TPR) repeat protein